VVVERIDEQLVEVGVDGDREVLGVADAGREVAVHERQLEDVRLVEIVERLLDEVLDELVEHLDVGRVDQLVAVDAARLVHVQSYHVDRRLAALRRREQHPLRTGRTHTSRARHS